MTKKAASRPPPRRAPIGRQSATDEPNGRDPSTLSAEEVRRLVHELQLHQAELETQNEELRAAQAELAHSRDRFNDLYDFAPVGYLTIDQADKICEANLTGVHLLTTERRRLVGSRLSRYVSRDCQDTLYLHLQEVRGGLRPQRCELTLLRADGSTFAAQLESISSKDPVTAELTCRIAVSDITERKQAEIRLQESLREKEVLLREIHHRVKNNLQVISSLVSLQTDGIIDPGVRALFADVRDRVRSIALVHELLYSSERLAMLDFAAYTQSLVRYLLHTHTEVAARVRLSLSIQAIALPVGAAVHCGLILNELVCNALKHAFPGDRTGELVISLDRDEVSGAVCLRVRDSGIGLPAGLSWRDSPSLGLRLVQMLAAQLRGTVEVMSGPGTEFQVKFALSGAMLGL